VPLLINIDSSFIKLNLTNMKKIYFVTVGLVISIFAFITCKPDPIDPPPPPANKPPIAKAGKDTSITLASCISIGNLVLDGSASFDPDSSSIAYLWTFLSAPNLSNANISQSKTSRPTVSKLRAGQYNIELTVTDPGRLYAKDTVTINVIGSTANGYDLDLTINGTFHFGNNYEECYYCYNPCCYYDLSYVEYGSGSFSPIGAIGFYAYEEADTATASDGHNTYFGLFTANNDVSVYGNSSINFKKVFQSGGGSFNGTFTPTAGSAINCDPNIFKNLAPLTVTGTLNATTNIITLNIKGKIYF
jgi:K319L-like, PKD domain